MNSDLLHLPTSLSPPAALHLSQEAPRVLSKATSSSLPYPLSLLSNSETPDTWIEHENLFLCCIRTGDDKSARQCLDRLIKRFGDKNEKIMALKGMYEEAVATDNKGLEKVLKEYERTLKEDPTNLPIRKRRVALLRSMSRQDDAISALVELLDSSPTDGESWAELSDLYFAQGLISQAIFALEEVLLVAPNAWNTHARMGELVYISATTDDGTSTKGVAESMRRFLRSIELCDNYLRGYYGLKLTTKRLISVLEKSGKVPTHPADSQYPDSVVPEMNTLQKLHELATGKLSEIVRRSVAGESGWDGYAEAEVIAAREILDKDVSNAPR